VVPDFAKVLKEGQSHFQIGNNTSLLNWIYVGIVAHAHILAADRLVPQSPSTPEELATSQESLRPCSHLSI